MWARICRSERAFSSTIAVFDRFGPVAVEERGQPLRAGLQGADLRADIADALLRHADVVQDDVDDVLVESLLAGQA